MSSLEEQFEQAFTEIVLGNTGKHLLEAEAVTECIVSGQSVTVTLDLPEDGALRDSIREQITTRLQNIEGISTVNVRLVGEPPPQAGPQAPPPGAEPRTPQRPEKVNYLDNYDAVIAVGSGKGGVGKSTVAINLAIALQQLGNKVSIFDADIYGPSLPIMMGLRNAKPLISPENRVVPLEKYGMAMLSIGNIVEEAAATVWRGPIIHQVIQQLLGDTNWPGGNFMIIDLPPGTGDTQLSISQLTELTGAVVVSTPQDVALLDAMKAVSMFQKVEIPVLGMVENMSSFICPSCSTETPIFDKGNAERMATQNNIPFLGRIPIEQSIREGGDNGIPVVTNPDSATAKAFKDIANNLLDYLESGA